MPRSERDRDNLPTAPDTFYTRSGKRLVDVMLGGVLLVVTAPLQLGIALVVRRKLGSPVLFRQVRPGRDGRPFTMVKFRTMTDVRGPDGELLPDAERLPPFGQLLRSTSLDELPELVNVVRGDLSLVGPRPLLLSYLDHYSPRQARRHEVRPGITGLAQVSGRNRLPWADRFELDVEYVQNVSLALDLRILWRTISSVLSRHGISAESSATMPQFTSPIADNALDS